MDDSAYHPSQKEIFTSQKGNTTVLLIWAYYNGLEDNFLLTARSEYVLTCGNWVLDEREQCDSGAYSLEGSDPCCTNACTLKKNANCRQVFKQCGVMCLQSPSS